LSSINGIPKVVSKLKCLEIKTNYLFGTLFKNKFVGFYMISKRLFAKSAIAVTLVESSLFSPSFPMML
jgi:hypothetical protein